MVNDEAQFMLHPTDVALDEQGALAASVTNGPIDESPISNGRPVHRHWIFRQPLCQLRAPSVEETIRVLSRRYIVLLSPGDHLNRGSLSFKFVFQSFCIVESDS
jgi:hypothetical protein